MIGTRSPLLDRTSRSSPQSGFFSPRKSFHRRAANPETLAEGRRRARVKAVSRLIQCAVRLRPADPQEGERLREIAIASKSYWGYAPDRVTEWAAMGDFSPAGLRRKEAHVADVDGRAVGWVAIIPRGAVLLARRSMGRTGLDRRRNRISPVSPRCRARTATRRNPIGMGGRTQCRRLLPEDGRTLSARQWAERVGTRVLAVMGVDLPPTDVRQA